MPRNDKMEKYLIQKTPFLVPTTDGKLIEEHHGKVATNNNDISIAHMVAPPKWSEPFQTPEFEEYTYILFRVKSNLLSKAKL